MDEIVVASREEDLMTISQLCQYLRHHQVHQGDPGRGSRAHSVLAGCTGGTDRDVELLAVQDGARPLVTPELIDRVIEAAARCGAAAPAVPVKDTIKAVREDGAVEETLERAACGRYRRPRSSRQSS